MLPNKLLFQDYCRRHGLWHLMTCLVLLFAGTMILSEDHNKDRNLPLSLGGLFIVFLYFDLSVKGYARVLLSLPLRVREISITLWWMAVPLPAIAVTLTMAFASLLSSGKPSFTVVNWLQFLALNFAMNSIFFLPLKSSPSPAGLPWKDRLISKLCGFIPIPIFFFGMNSRELLQNDWRTWNTGTQIVIFFGAAFTVLSFRQGADLLRAVTRRTEDAGIRSPLVTTAPQGQWTGISYLYLHVFRTDLNWCIYTFLYFIISLYFSSDHVPLSQFGKIQHHNNWDQVLYFSVVISIIIRPPWLTDLRHWRSLPLSSSQLARLLIKLTGVTSTVLLLPVILLLLVQNNWHLLLPLIWPGLLCLASVCLLNAIAAHYNRIALAVFVMVCTALETSLSYQQVDWAQYRSLCVVLGSALILLAYKIHLSFLRKGCRAYLFKSSQTQSGQ